MPVLIQRLQGEPMASGSTKPRERAFRQLNSEQPFSSAMSKSSISLEKIDADLTRRAG